MRSIPRLIRANIPPRPLRKLDDEELDSGDDEDRNDRLMDDADGDIDMGIEGHSANIMDVKLGRHAVPDPSDGEVTKLSLATLIPALTLIAIFHSFTSLNSPTF